MIGQTRQVRLLERTAVAPDRGGSAPVAGATSVAVRPVGESPTRVSLAWTAAGTSRHFTVARPDEPVVG